MTDPSLPPYQTLVGEFVALHNLEADVETRLLDLLSELGELAKEALKASQYGKRTGINTDEWTSELGGCLLFTDLPRQYDRRPSG